MSVASPGFAPASVGAGELEVLQPARTARRTETGKTQDVCMVFLSPMRRGAVKTAGRPGGEFSGDGRSKDHASSSRMATKSLSTISIREDTAVAQMREGNLTLHR